MRTFQPCCRNVIFFAPTYGFYPRIVKASYQYKMLCYCFREHFTWDLGNWIFLSSKKFFYAVPWSGSRALAMTYCHSNICHVEFFSLLSLDWRGSQGAQLTRLRRLSGLAPGTPWKAATNGFPFFQKLPEVKQGPAQARIVESMTFLVYSSIPKVILTILRGRDGKVRYRVAFGAP